MRRLLAAVAAATVVLTVSCSTSSDGGAAGTSSPTASSAPASSAPASSGPASSSPSAAGPTTSAPPDAGPDVQQLSITVSGSSVTGDTGTVKVQLGKKVQLTVTSDVADEVHVHGADVSKDVPAGGTVVIDFVQQAPGRFEVELESRKRVLTRLQVS